MEDENVMFAVVNIPKKNKNIEHWKIIDMYKTREEAINIIKYLFNSNQLVYEYVNI